MKTSLNWLPALMLALLAVGCSDNDPMSSNNGPIEDPETGSSATMEIAGLGAAFEAVVFSGPGYDFERIPGFRGDGTPDDTPGRATERNLVLEIATADAGNLMDYFDSYFGTGRSGDPRLAGSIVVPDLLGDETYRWNFFEFAPIETYSAGSEGRTHFELECLLADDTAFGWNTDRGADPFGTELSNNPATDTLVEISGVTVFYPVVEIDEVGRTLTFDFDFVEGQGIYTWVASQVGGLSDRRSLSIIQEESGTEVSRRNYFDCFPISYVQYSGYDHDATAKARVTLSFNVSEDGNQ